MRITDALAGEHGLFYALFGELDARRDEAASLPALRAAVVPVGAALITHAQLEDELLFPALQSVFGAEGPLAVMRTEHVEIEALLARIERATHLDDACSLLAELLAVARAHFETEEGILFPAANSHLEPSTLHELGRRWAERRGVLQSS